MPSAHELTAAQLYHACDPADLECDSSADLPDLQASLGQERAMGALHFGVGIRHEGYNLYVMGSPGLGKHAIVRELLGQQAAQQAPPSDWCYINNFRTPYKPRVLRLPAGTGCGLQGDLRALVRSLLGALPAAFDSDEYRNAMQGLKDRYKAREEELFGSVDSQARAAGIILLRTRPASPWRRSRTARCSTPRPSTSCRTRKSSRSRNAPSASASCCARRCSRALRPAASTTSRSSSSTRR